MIFDSHAHYDDEAFAADRDALLGGMRKSNVGYIINVGAEWQGALESVKLAGRFPYVYAAVGVHPDGVGELNEEKMCRLKELCHGEKTVAVGEIGLDYHGESEETSLQKEWFVRQMQLAKDEGLPIIVHSREAAQDTFDLIKRVHAGSTGGVIHCYSGSCETAKDYLKLGYHIGVGGVVTFRNARVLKEVVACVPLTSILVETDCPYLAPTPFRGKRNQSSYLSYVIDAIAAIKNIPAQEVERVTYENAMRLFGIREAE